MLQKIDAINNSTGNTEQPSSFIWCLLLLAEVLGMHAVFHECIKKLATILQLHISKQISRSSDTGSGANFNNSSNDGGRVKRAFTMSYLPRPVTNIPGINMDANSIDSLEKRLLTHLSQYTSLLNLSLLQAFKRKQIGMRNNRDHHDVSNRSSSSSSNKTAIITPTSDIATTNSNKSSNVANNNTGSKSISGDYFQNIGVVDSGGTVSHTNTTIDNSDVSTINSSTKAADKHRDLVVLPSKLSSSAATEATNTMHHPRSSLKSHTNNADYHHDDDADEESLSEDKEYSNSSSDLNHDHLSNPSIATDVTDISDLSMTPIAHYMKRDKSYHSERKRVSSSTTDTTWIPHVIDTHAHHTARGYSDDHHSNMSNKHQKGYTAHQNHISHYHSHHDYHSSRHYENSVKQNDKYHHLTHGSNNADDYGDEDYDDHEYDNGDDHDVLWSIPKHSPTEPVPLHTKSVYNYRGHYRPSSNPSGWVDDDDDDDDATTRGRRWSADNRVMEDDDDDRSRDYPSHHQHTNDRPHNIHRDNSNHHHHNQHHNQHHHYSRTVATVRSISPHDRIHHHQSSSTASTSPQRRKSPGVVAFGSSTPRSLVDSDDHFHQSHSSYSSSNRFLTTASLKTNITVSPDNSNNDHNYHSSSSPYHRSTRSKTPPTSSSSSSSSSSGRRDNRSSNNNITTTYPSSIITSPPQLPSQVMNHHHHHSPVLSPDDLKMSREIALLRLKEVKVKEEINASRRQAEVDMRENRLKALELKTAVLRMKASPSKITSSNVATAMVISTTTGTTTTTNHNNNTNNNNNNNNNNRNNNNNSNAPTTTAHDSIIITTDALSGHHQVPSPNVDTNININDYSHRLAVKSPLRQPMSSHQGVDSLNRIHSNSDGHARINEASYSSTDNIPNTNAATITHSAISTTSPMQPQPLSAEQVSVDDSVVMMTMIVMDDRDDDDDDSEIMIDNNDDDYDNNGDDSCNKHLSTHHISYR